MASPVPAPRDLKNINVKTTHSQPNRPPRRRDTVLVKKPPASTEQENSKRKNRAPAHLTLKIDAEYLKVANPGTNNVKEICSSIEHTTHRNTRSAGQNYTGPNRLNTSPSSSMSAPTPPLVEIRPWRSSTHYN